jgi:hypothetical protein
VKVRYKNGFFNGIRNEKGIFIWDSGDIYIGEFKNDLFNGKGFMIKKDEYKLIG